MPSNNLTSAKVSITSRALIRRATWMARHLRENSSISVISRKRRPSLVRGSIKSKAPDMGGRRRPKPDAGSIIEPKPASLWLLLRHLQPLAAPDALNPILANLNAACVQQGRHPAIAVTAILRGKEDDIPRQLIFIRLERGNIALCSPWLPDDPAGQPIA